MLELPLRCPYLFTAIQCPSLHNSPKCVSDVEPIASIHFVGFVSGHRQCWCGKACVHVQFTHATAVKLHKFCVSALSVTGPLLLVRPYSDLHCCARRALNACARVTPMLRLCL